MAFFAARTGEILPASRTIQGWVFDPKVNEYVQLLRDIRYYGRYRNPKMEAIRKKRIR